jgi:hypothetical protein
LVQAAVWTRGPTGEITSWRVSSEIWDEWNMLDHVQQAGLMLHEIFYVLHDERIHVTGRQQNARYVRQFVASISSSWLEGASRDEWDSLMAAMNLF